MNKRFIAVFLLILLASTVAFILPDIGLFSDKVTLALCFAALGTQAAATFFFLTSLHAFKKELKIAYVLLALGILMFGITQIQLPIVSFVTVDPLILSWIIVITSLLGSVIMFFAIRKFARLLQLQTPWASPLIAGAGALVLTFLSTFIPHAPLEGVSELVNDAIFGTFIASGSLCIATAMTTLRIRQKLSQRYKKALTWLAAALFVAAFASFHETLVKELTYFSQFENYYAYGISIWPLLLSAALFLKASLAFKQTSQELRQLPESASAIDVVTFAAQMASDPSAIDKSLDKVRDITIRHTPGTKLSADDQTTLTGVYLQIEKYLLTKEPLRKFTKEGLRELLPDNFQQLLANK